MCRGGTADGVARRRCLHKPARGGGWGGGRGGWGGGDGFLSLVVLGEKSLFLFFFLCPPLVQNKKTTKSKFWFVGGRGVFILFFFISLQSFFLGVFFFSLFSPLCSSLFCVFFRLLAYTFSLTVLPDSVHLSVWMPGPQGGCTEG